MHMLEKTFNRIQLIYTIHLLYQIENIYQPTKIQVKIKKERAEQIPVQDESRQRNSLNLLLFNIVVDEIIKMQS